MRGTSESTESGVPSATRIGGGRRGDVAAISGFTSDAASEGPLSAHRRYRRLRTLRLEFAPVP